MKFKSAEILATMLSSWLSGFLLGLWRLVSSPSMHFENFPASNTMKTPYITDREAGLIFALFLLVTMVAVHQHLNKNAVVAYLKRYVGEVHNMMLLDLQESHRKRIAHLKASHNQAMYEAHDEMRRIHAKFDRLDSEYDWMSAVYQDQMRTNQEQEDRIAFLEARLREFGQLTPSATAAPFSAPASQTNFTRPQRRARGALMTSSPLSQPPLVQAPEGEEA